MALLISTLTLPRAEARGYQLPPAMGGLGTSHIGKARREPGVAGDGWESQKTHPGKRGRDGAPRSRVFVVGRLAGWATSHL